MGGGIDETFQRFGSVGAEIERHIRRSAKTWVFVFFFVVLLLGALISLMDFSITLGGPIHMGRTHWETQEFPLRCSEDNSTQKCPLNYPTSFEVENSSTSECPDYFRWIHQDLGPWKNTGITREMIERGKDRATFRLVILKGKVYVETYSESFQTRDVFTIWGILQLLRLYPGKVPDLELMFWCNDQSAIKKHDYNVTFHPPPVFHYCGHQDSYDIVFPDWTFWGWAETNIRPWTSMSESLIEGNERIEWKDRTPYAFWKGNPNVSPGRGDLMKCNVSDNEDWNVHLYTQNWRKATKDGYKNSKLEDQCTYRYKIYIEGASWSVSEKYILACNSMTLLIKPEYYDFFTRSLEPMKHYWPISAENKCRNLKFAVDWGNTHINEARTIGETGSGYIQKYIQMNYVYDYMLYVLTEYANLLKFKPEIPQGAKEMCSETMACGVNGLVKDFMMDSMVMSPSYKLPCTTPSPLEPHEIVELGVKRESIRKQVVAWETQNWDKENIKQ